MSFRRLGNLPTGQEGILLIIGIQSDLPARRFFAELEMTEYALVNSNLFFYNFIVGVKDMHQRKNGLSYKFLYSKNQIKWTKQEEIL